MNLNNEGYERGSMDGPRSETGRLKVFVGAAPGVGKTYTMLREANAMRERGIDVVIGYVDVHGRPDTAAQLGGLEILPTLSVDYQGRVFQEVDLKRICERHPEVVVIDELAHSNAPGSMFPKRHMDVAYLLDHGISVLCAVNVQHIEGIHEEAAEVTGVRVRELIPAEFIRQAQEVEVIDVTPETLRQRLRDGSIYPMTDVDQALQHFFRKSNLSGLRELALRAVADDVDERLEKAYGRQKIPGPVGAKETIMVCVNYLPRALTLISRGYRMAERMKADFYVLYVVDSAEDLLSSKERERSEKLREMAVAHDAEWIVEARDDRKVGEVIMAVAERINVTQIVIGQSSRTRKRAWQLAQSPVRYLLRHTRYIDLRIVGWSTQQVAVSGGDASKESAPIERATTVKSGAQNIEKRKGRLTIYVGAAPGVGKTYKMLGDAHDWKRRGIDVVVGLVETHGREETAQQILGLELLPRRRYEFEGRYYEELDVDAILSRDPDIVIVDELPHSNTPGSERDKRYQDILYLLEAGVNVVTAVNIQHLESLHDKVEHITGIKVRERIPDWFMKLAREVKLIDVTPETLHQRLLEGKIYSRDKIQQAIENFFQVANLSALREMALLEVADDVDQRMERVREGGLCSPYPERILVCVNHRPHSEKLIRKGWRLADRLHAKLFVLVVVAESLSEQDERDLERIRRLSEQFEAQYLTRPVLNRSIGQTIVHVAGEVQAGQMVTGQPLPPTGLVGYLKRTPVDYVLEHAEFVDLHVVAIAREGSA